MTTDELQRWASIFRWFGLSVTAIGILITFGSYYVADKLLVVQRADNTKALERQKVAEDQSASAQAQAAEAKKLAAELKSKLDLVTQQRRLTDEQKSRFKDFMRGKHTGPIRVMSISTSNEVKEFVNQLRALLDDNGCQLPPNSLVRIVMGDVSISNHPEGTAILVRSTASSPAYAGDVQKAFEYIDIPMPGIEIRTEQTAILDGEVVVFVSERSGASM